MRKKTIWTIELPEGATDTGRLRSAIINLNGTIVNIKEEALPFTDKECFFWRKRWEMLPITDIQIFGSTRTVYTFYNHGNKLKVGVAKCHKEDPFNSRFGRALADARCFGDRKLERALLHFTPEQIERYF